MVPAPDTPTTAIAATGTWLYQDVAMPVDIVGLPYDFWYEIGSADDQLQPGETPVPLNPDGLLFYIRFRTACQPFTRTWVDSIGYPTLTEAQHAAQAQVPSPIHWTANGPTP